jgi:hypothetical protein
MENRSAKRVLGIGLAQPVAGGFVSLYSLNMTSMQTKFQGRLISSGDPSIPTDFQTVFLNMVGWALLDGKDLLYGAWCEKNGKCSLMEIDIIKVGNENSFLSISNSTMLLRFRSFRAFLSQ